MTDLLIIGGGAAGLMAAGAACARGLTTAVVEHNPKGPGQKLLITGKGRCNVTNDCDVREFLNYVRHNPRFLYSALYAFSPASAMELFESLGVPLKTERGRRVFPQSDRAADVLAALRSYAADAKFVHGSAKELLIEDGRCVGVRTADGKPTAQPMFWLLPAAPVTPPPAAMAPAISWHGRRATPLCRPSPACAAWSARIRPAAR